MNFNRFFAFALSLCAALLLSFRPLGAQEIKLTVLDTARGPLIPKEIYGQFSEHLGRCIYGGIWVGEDSPIPNISGYRKDVLEALKELRIPVLRWPGGCFADEYHWQDGIGPRESRPRMINSNWGGTLEDNSFGTNEFLNLCELLGAEPYISGNVGSGSVEEMAKWVEYMTAEDGTMASLRKANGREKPWRVKYLGVGNESWGCGGNMTPEYYSDLYRRYSTYCREFDGNRLYKVASGASDYDYNWTRVLMQKVGGRMNGLSLHYYTVIDWNHKGSATEFTDGEYYDVLAKSVEVEDVLQKHCFIMDTFDPEKKIGLLLDEWGTWFDVEKGTNPGHLFQQNTMRDAMVAALSLNIFNKHTDRLRMANIAQVVNVLQAMVLTEGDRMVMTPTYYVFKMFRGHQDAAAIGVEYAAESLPSPSGRELPSFSASCSLSEDGTMLLTLVNPALESEEEICISFASETLAGGGEGVSLKAASRKASSKAREVVSAEILRSDNVHAHNTFDSPSAVAPAPFKGVRSKNGELRLRIPAASIVAITVK